MSIPYCTPHRDRPSRLRKWLGWVGSSLTRPSCRRLAAIAPIFLAPISIPAIALAQVDRPTDITATLSAAIAPQFAAGTSLSLDPWLRSGLALAQFNLRRSGIEDGALTALEAIGLNLLGTDLVVLSACETGLGEIRTGQGVYGLRRGFTIAGADSLVLSLWQVDDVGTQVLMNQFYTYLLAGQGRGQALRQVKLDLLSSTEYRHPYYWAAFILAGEWQAL